MSMQMRKLAPSVVQAASAECIKASVLLNGEHFTETIAYGVIVATLIGSTGYAMNCGGPIVSYRAESFILVGNPNAELSAAGAQ